MLFQDIQIETSLALEFSQNAPKKPAAHLKIQTWKSLVLNKRDNAGFFTQAKKKIYCIQG